MTDKIQYSDYYHAYYYQYHYTLLTIAVLYLPLIFTIKWYMSDKSAYKSPICNKLLGIWNIFLGVSSGIGAYYAIPYIIHDINTNGFIQSICDGVYRYDDTVSNIVILFNFSKFLEFIDTLFIVYRKSQLEFLHYYHHILTCVYCWISGYIGITTGIYFAGINLAVHAIMYSYYALVALDLNIFYKYRKCITVIQTGQMWMGIYIIVKWLYECSNTSNSGHILNHIMGLIMYMTYGYLFSRILLRQKKSQ